MLLEFPAIALKPVAFSFGAGLNKNYRNFDKKLTYCYGLRSAHLWPPAPLPGGEGFAPL